MFAGKVNMPANHDGKLTGKIHQRKKNSEAVRFRETILTIPWKSKTIRIIVPNLG